MESKTYKLEQSFLHRLRSKRNLAIQLGVAKNFFCRPFKIQYRTHDIVQDNKIRTINDPVDRFKRIQRNLLKYLQRISTPDWLISGKKGKTYITNAEHHCRNEYVLTADISNFYNSCKEEHVKNMFKNKFRMSSDVARVLTQLVCLGGFLPTGAPTSQLIAYWTYSDIFDNINQIATKNGCIFSLYVDDMTFSSKKPIEEKVIYAVNRELKKVGLLLKKGKTKHYSCNEFKLITGTVIDVNGVLKVPNKRRLSIIKTYEEYSRAEGVAKEKLRQRAVGRINAARQIEREIFPDLYSKLKRKAKKTHLQQVKVKKKSNNTRKLQNAE